MDKIYVEIDIPIYDDILLYENWDILFVLFHYRGDVPLKKYFIIEQAHFYKNNNILLLMSSRHVNIYIFILLNIINKKFFNFFGICKKYECSMVKIIYVYYFLLFY